MQNQNIPSEKMAMNDKVVMITGANSGIGKTASLALAKMGANVVRVTRNKEKGEAARSEIIRESQNGSVDLLLADLSSLESVRTLATEFQKKYSKLHVLINNAGLFNQRRNVSSVGHYNGHVNFDDLNLEKGYGGWKAYGQSKLALVLFTHELAKKLPGTGVTVNAVHPGTVATNIWTRPLGPAGFIMALPKLFMASPKQGAETIVYLASSDDAKDLNGEYLEKLKVKKSSDESYDEQVAQRLWDISAKLTHLSWPLQ